MKNNALYVVVVVLVCAVVVWGTFWAGRAYEQYKVETNLYPKSAVITYIDKDTDLVLIEDFFGNRFLFDDADEWMVGDMVGLIMDNNGTPEDLTDDEILAISYEGWIE